MSDLPQKYSLIPRQDRPSYPVDLDYVYSDDLTAIEKGIRETIEITTEIQRLGREMEILNNLLHSGEN